MDFQGGSMIKNLPANIGDMGLISGSRRSLRKEMATHSTWRSTVHGVEIRVRHNLVTKTTTYFDKKY